MIKYLTNSFKPFRFFAWQNVKEEIDFEVGSRNGWIYLIDSRIAGKDRSGKYINAKLEADLVSISTYSKSHKLKKYKHRKNQHRLCRNDENLYSILGCFLVLNFEKLIASNLITSYADLVIHRLNYYKIPLPTYLIAKNHMNYHCYWYFEYQLKVSNPKVISCWKLMQNCLYHLGRDLGVEFAGLEDCHKLLLNQNKKYETLIKSKKIRFVELMTSFKKSGVRDKVIINYEKNLTFPFL